MNTTENKFFLPGAVILAGLLIGGAVIWNGSHPQTGDTSTKPTTAVDVKNVSLADDPYIGNKDAPITIAFWTDYQCPYCKAVEVGHSQIPIEPALPQIIKDYVDTGKAKVVFMDFVFLGPDSQTAALYGRSVWKLYPDKYFTWRTAMYEAQDAENSGFGDEASVKTLTSKIAGIDGAKVAADVKANTGAYQAMIDADRAEGQKVGVDATPSLLVGKQFLKGAYPYANIKTAIDASL